MSRGEWFAVFRIWVFEAIYVRWFYMVLCRIFAWRFLSDFYGRFEFCFFSFGDCFCEFFCSIFEFLYQQILRISRFLKMCFLVIFAEQVIFVKKQISIIFACWLTFNFVSPFSVLFIIRCKVWKNKEIHFSDNPHFNVDRCGKIVEKFFACVEKCGKLSIQKLHNSDILRRYIRKMLKLGRFSHKNQHRKCVSAFFRRWKSTTEKCIFMFLSTSVLITKKDKIRICVFLFCVTSECDVTDFICYTTFLLNIGFIIILILHYIDI